MHTIRMKLVLGPIYHSYGLLVKVMLESWAPWTNGYLLLRARNWLMQMQPRVSPQTFLWRREELISNLKFLASLIMLYARLIMQASDLLLLYRNDLARISQKIIWERLFICAWLVVFHTCLYDEMQQSCIWLESNTMPRRMVSSLFVSSFNYKARECCKQCCNCEIRKSKLVSYRLLHFRIK